MRDVMKKLLWCGLLLALTTGCAGPKFSGSGINNLDAQSDEGQQIKAVDYGKEVVIIKDKETREGFLDAMVNWLRINEYKFTVIQDNDPHVKDKIHLTYVGLWSWDLALYLADAHITAFYNNEQIGKVDFKNGSYFSLNPNKFGRGEKRIFKMMDRLFGVETPYDAE